MNRILIALISLLAFAGVKAQNQTPGQWRLYNTWDGYPDQVIDTPDRTYYVMKGQGFWDYGVGWAEDSSQLFVLDKESGEMQEYNAANYLHGNIIQHVAYNARKGYLLLVYNDYSIDLLYDDDNLYTVPGLSTATLTAAKDVNNVTFDADNNRAYLATAFGYMVIDDKDYVVAESRVYNRSLTGIGRVGDMLVASCADGLFTSPISDRHISWDSFSPVAGISGNVQSVLPLNDTQVAYSLSGMNLATFAPDGTATTTKLYGDAVRNFAENKQGYYFLNDWQIGQLRRDGTHSRVNVPTSLRGKKSGTWDFVTMYSSLDRDGYVANRYDSSTGEWTQTLKAPSIMMQPYKIFHIAFSPEYGVMAANEPFNRFQATASIDYRHLISFYKDGAWRSIGGSVETSSPFASNNRSGYGPVFDPADPDVLWGGSFTGLFKYQMPEGTMSFYTYAGGPGNGKTGFHAVFPSVSGGLGRAHIGTPAFDEDGTMWLFQNVTGSTANNYSPLYYWTAADRLADNTAGLKTIPTPEYSKFGATGAVYPLRHSSNRNIVLFNHPTEWEGGIYILNHGGTLDNSSDDKLVHLTNFVDQNGTSFTPIYINCLYEDPETGVIWVGSSTGLFTFRPTDVLGGKTTVNRIVVSRNDGTGQGDYLLNGIDIYHINADGAGRKWFSTIGNGIIITSASGDEVVERLNTDNSLIPSNSVFVTVFDPNSNAAWIGTSQQLATYYTDVTPGEANFDNVLSYPNPVRPDFYGEVTIQGLMDGSLVKILDQGGNLVKELGVCHGGMITWNLTNLEGARVATGIYLISASNETSSSACVGKILVVK